MSEGKRAFLRLVFGMKMGKSPIPYSLPLLLDTKNMALDPRLSEFVKESLVRGLSRSAIEASLLRAGWRPDQINSALSSFADIEFPVPVPTPEEPSSAKDAFLYLILFTTLYISAFNLGSLILQLMEYALLQGGENTDYIQDNIRQAVASLIIALPVYWYVFRLQRAALLRDPARRASGVRKWLTYLTLFITASVIIGDLISLVYNLIGGGLTTRYVLQFLTIGVINTMIFWYYLLDMRGD